MPRLNIHNRPLHAAPTDIYAQNSLHCSLPERWLEITPM
jgi:hypothetical protein